jgi:putative protease
MSKPEVLSPAGRWPQLHAAIEAGADAVYFGCSNTLTRSVLVSISSLPERI